MPGPPPPPAPAPPPPPLPSIRTSHGAAQQNPTAGTSDRGALLSDITRGAKLKKAITNDRSAPLVLKSTSAAINVSTPPQTLAPPVPGGAFSNRARSSSDGGVSGPNGENGLTSPAPQLAGIFLATGIPRLRKGGGGIDTGRDSSFNSDTDSSRSSNIKPPGSNTLKPLSAARTALKPNALSSESLQLQPSNAPLANLRKYGPTLNSQPNSDISKNPPPLPGTSKPPPPPVAWRKPSSTTTPLQSSTTPASSSFLPPAHPGRPPASLPTAFLNSLPISASLHNPSPPPPPASNPPSPPRRPTPLPSQSNNNLSNENFAASLAVQAARNAFGVPESPAAPPPAPPMPSRHAGEKSAPEAILPKPPTSRKSAAQQKTRSILDASSYTLSNGDNIHSAPSRDEPEKSHTPSKIIDIRWNFQDEDQLPKPREFLGTPKKYRAGRGSSVPLKHL